MIQWMRRVLVSWFNFPSMIIQVRVMPEAIPLWDSKEAHRMTQLFLEYPTLFYMLSQQKEEALKKLILLPTNEKGIIYVEIISELRMLEKFLSIPTKSAEAETQLLIEEAKKNPTSKPALGNLV